MIDKVEQALSREDFDAVKFVGDLLPDVNSLQELPAMIRELRQRSARYTQSIREAVRSYSVLGDSSEQILGATRNSIVDLSQKIANIHEQATETERIVTKICDGIKPLDRAKCNLTVTVAALRRLKQIVAQLDVLESNIKENNYQQCADCVLLLNPLIDSFKEHSKRPQIAPFVQRYFDLKRTLRNQLNLEMESRLFKGSADETNLPLCAVIDAFQDDFRDCTIDLFCEKLMAPYDDAYESSPLKDVSKRMQWFKQRIDFYNKQYSTAFPPDWKMQYHLSRMFCAKTAAHLAKVMSETPPEISVYLKSFELVVKFEQKMAEQFAKTEMVYIDKDAVMPEFDNTPEGVKKKVEWRMRKEQGIGEPVKVPAREFLGSIASAFAPYMSMYLSSERENLEKLIKKSTKNPIGDIDEESKQLTSATTLVVSMKGVIDKCATFNVPGSLLDLFMNLKTLLGQYAETLTRILPTKFKSDQEFKLLCAITNTCSLLMSVVDSLSTKVKQLLDDPDLAGGIIVEDTKETIGSELRKQLVYMADVVVKEMETPLIQIANNTWGEDVSENGKVPMKLTDAMSKCFPVIQNFLSNDNMNRVRSTIAQKAANLIHDVMFKQKHIKSEAASRISTAVREVRDLIIYWTKADSVLAKKRVQGEFAKLETVLIVLTSPEIAKPEAYVSKMMKPDKDHFKAILKLGGIPSDEEKELLEAYDKALYAKHQELEKMKKQ